MKHTKQLLMILLVVFLLVGLGTLAASDVTKNDTSVTKSTDVTKTSTVSKDTASTSKIQTTQKNDDNNKIVDSKPNSKTKETLKNKTIKKTDSRNEGKTTSITYDVTTFNQLNSSLTSMDYDTVTLNINSNIDLENNITVCGDIKILTINGNDKTINGQNQYQFLYINSGSTVSINNLNIENCTALEGGAIQNRGTLTITNSNINNNSVTASNGKGGAIYNNQGYITIQNSSLTYNTATRGSGGAIYNNLGYLTIENSSLTYNTARNGDGGAINNIGGTLNITNSNLTNNNANYGGAVYNTRSGNINIINSNLTYNTANEGGVIHNNPGNINITNSNLTYNTVTTNGGAIYSTVNSNVNIRNSNLTNNKAGNDGGAIRNSGNLNITNSNLTDNNATRYGGAIYGYTNSFIIINNTKITNNTATGSEGSGGAIYNRGNLNITNSSLNNNTANGQGTSGGGAIYNTETLNITDTNITHNTADNGDGGAIINLAGNLNIRNSNLTNNNAYQNGGAITNTGTVNITGTNIIHNTAEQGGAIRNYEGTLHISESNLDYNNAKQEGGSIWNYGKLNITLSTLNNNTANEGGAIRNYGNLTIHNSTLNNNSVTWGGAINNNNGNITITNSTINNNLAYGGGAINNDLGNITLIGATINNNTGSAIRNHGNITLDNSTLNNNNAGVGSGAAIFNNANMTITNSTLNNNIATFGGAILNYVNMRITDSTLNNNTASQFGGAIQTSGKLKIKNTTLEHNTAGWGGAISNNANMRITDSTLNNNTAGSGGAIITGLNSNNTLENSRITNNHVSLPFTYVVDFKEANSAIIIDNTFINNTDNLRDMLFSDAKEDALIDIHDNIYIDNFLEDKINFTADTSIIIDDEDRNYDYDLNLDLRSIYNDTVHNGTVNVYVNGNLEGTSQVTDGKTSISYNNKDLRKRENEITLEYISSSKHYQNTTNKFTVLKEINTTLTIEAPQTMISGDTADINFTLKDQYGNIVMENVHVYLDNINVENLTITASGDATYYFTPETDGTVVIVGIHHTDSDSFYKSTGNVEAIINVIKIQPEIKITNLTEVTAHHETEFLINLTDHEGKPIPEKVLNITISKNGKPDNNTQITTNNTGLAIIKITPEDDEPFWINATYPGNVRYHHATEKIGVKPGLVITNLEIIATDTKINTTNTITIKVIANNNALINGTVTLNISGEIHTVEILYGSGTYTEYNSTTAGDKNITGKFTSTTPGYGHSFAEEEFTVDKLPTQANITLLNNKAGNVTLKVTIQPKENIASIVNGGLIEIKTTTAENERTIYSGELENGEVIFKTDIEEIGRYDFEVIYHGNDYFTNSEDKIISIEILPINTTTTTYNKTTIIGSTITLNATLQDETGLDLEGETIQFYLNNHPITHPNGENVTAKIINGIATTEYTLTPAIAAGTHTITAKYNGSTKYAPSTHDATLTVEKIPTNTTIEILDTTLTNVTIKVKVTNKTGDKVTQGTITILNENNIPITRLENIPLTNGEQTITIPATNAGPLKIKVQYNENDIYQASNATNQTTGQPIITIDVTKIPTQTQVEILDTTLTNVTIKVTTTNKTGDKVTQGTITIKDKNGQTLTTQENIQLTNGEATVKLNINQAGETTIQVHYNENNIYQASNATNQTTGQPIITIDVTKIPTQTQVEILDTTLTNVTIKVTTTNKTGDKVTQGTITIKDKNGQTLTTQENIQLTNGEATVKLNINQAGETTIQVHYNENNIYQASNATNQTTGQPIITIDVTKIPTQTQVEILDTTLTNVTIKVTTTNKTGDKVTQGTITIKDKNGQTLTTQENIQLTNGEATVKLNINQAGETTIQVHYNENNIYQASNATNQTTGQPIITIDVTKIPTQTQVEILDTTLTNVTIKVTTTNKTGDKVTQGTITIKDKNGQTLTTQENIQLTNGEATVKLNINQAGETTIQVHYNENNIYQASNATNQTTGQPEITINVEKIPTQTQVEILDTTLTNVTIKVTTTNKTGDKVTQGTITIKDKNGQTLTTQENIQLTNGEATVKLNINQAGETTIQVHYNENNIYQASNATNQTTGQPEITINVEKIPTQTQVEILDTTLTNVTIKVTTTNKTNEPVTKGNITILNENNIPITTLENIPLTNGEQTITIPATNAGPLKIKVQYNENDIYQASNATNQTTGQPIITIDVTKIPTQTQVEILDTTLTNVTIKVTTTNKTGDKVTQGTITIKDKNGQTLTTQENIQLTNGEATVKLNINQAGETTIQVHYNENNIYKPSNAKNQTNGENIPIPVTKIPTTTTITVNGNTVKNINATGRVTDKFNKLVTEGTVIIRNGNSEVGRATITNGQYNIPLNINTQGRYNLVAQYMGTNTYLPSNSTTATVNVNPIDTKISANIPDPTKDNTTIKVNLTDKDGKAIPKASVNITLPNGTTIPTTTDNNGIASVPVNLPVGPQTIKVSYPGNGTYKPSNTTLNVNIGKIPTTTTGRVLNNTAGNVIVTGTVKDKYGRNVPEGTVSIKTGNTEIGKATVTNGAFTTTTTINTGGNYPITLQYLGTNTYLPSNANLGTVTVTPRTSQITVKPEGTIAGTTNVTVTLKDPITGKPIPNAPITVTLPNGSKVTGTTDNNGNIKVPVDLPKGNNKVKIDYPGNQTYKPSTTTVDIPVTGKTPTIQVTPEGNKVGKTNITTTLKDPITGKPIPNAPITITLPNETKITATTGSNGTVKVPVDLREGLNTVTVTYTGNETYNPISNKTTFNISKNPVNITLNPIKGIIGEKITLTAYITDEDGKPISGGNLAFKLNGKTLRSDGRFDSNAPAMKFSVKDGKVTYTINADLYLRNAKNLTAAYSGNYKYEETGSPTVEAQIQKRYAGVTLTVTPTQNKQYDTIKFTATVRDTTKNGKNQTLINQNTTVMFKVNGNTLRDKNKQIIYVPVNANKQATYNYQIPAGTGGITASKAVRDYKVEAIFVGINYYPGARNNSKFNVERSSTTVTIKEVKVVAKTNVLSVKATLTDYKGNNLIGTNKVTVKINGRSYIDPKNGKPKYWSVKNGVVDLSGITVDPKTTIKRVMVVTGERQAYTEGRAESTTILRA